MKAYQIFEKPNSWTRGTFARDKFLDPVATWNPQACQFCIVGALKRVYPDESRRVDAISRVREVLLKRCTVEQWGSVGVSYFNDHIAQSQSEIHALLKEANV